MKATLIFQNSFVSYIVFTIIIVAMHSCGAEEYYTVLETTVEDIHYIFDNDTNEAEATGYIVKGGNLLTRICLPDKLTVHNLNFTVTAIKVIKLGGIVVPALLENAFEPEVYTSATVIVPKGCDVSSTVWANSTTL